MNLVFYRQLRLLPASLLFVSAAALAPAQPTTTSEPSRSSDEAFDEQVVTLGEFQVMADKDKNYTASDTVTGTRVSSKIRDLPFLVNVVTSEFLQDFAAFDMSQQLGWIGNVSPSDSDGSLILRGFTSTPYVDGFRRLGPLDLVDTARIEIIKGPSASIYGQTLPGGVVNYTSKRPKTRTEYVTNFSVGSHRLLRGDLSATGPVGKSTKLFYMVNLADYRREFEQAWAKQHRASGSVQFLYKPDAKTNLNIKFTGQGNFNRDRQSIPWVKSSTSAFLTNNGGVLGRNVDGTPLQYTYTSIRAYDAATNTYTTRSNTANLPLPKVLVRYNMTQADLDAYNAYVADPSRWTSPLALSTQLQTTNSWDRLATEWPTMHTNGPLSYNESRLFSGNISGDRRWNDLVSTKATFDVFNRPSEDQTISGNQMYYTDPNYPDGNVGGSTPTFRERYNKGYSGQIDNLFAFETGPVQHKFLVTFDFTHKDDRDFRRTTDTSTNNKYLITDPSGLTYFLTLPLGPRSTGSYVWNGTTRTYSAGTQYLDWPQTMQNYWYPTYDEYPELYSKTTINEIKASDDYGLFMSERAIFFKGRLIAMAGARYDRLYNTYKNALATDPAQRRRKWTDDALTYQTGLTGYATKNIILFANWSTAYNPNMQVVQRRVPTGFTLDEEGNEVPSGYSFEPVVLPNEKGDGYEFGTKFILFNDRLNISLSRFVMDSKNKVDSYTNEYGINEAVGDGARRSKGYEVDMNWAVTDSFQCNVSYGYNDTRYTKNTLAYLVGTTTPQNSKNNVGVVLRYELNKGWAKGLRFTAGARYYDKSLINVGSGGFVTTNPYATTGFKPLIRNTPLNSGVLPFPDLPAGLVVLSRNNPTSGNEPTGAINPNSGTVLTNKQVNKGFVAGVNVPASWVPYTGQAMAEGTTYYTLDGDGSTASSYTRKTNIDDNRSNVFNDSYMIYNFGVSYSFKQSKKLSHSIRFNVQNAFDKFYTYGNGVLGYGREYTLSYSLAFK